jgi:hypothetical protein
MIELNLLPEDLKLIYKRKTQRAVKLPVIKINMKPIVIGMAAVFITLHLGLGLLAILQKHNLSKLNGKIETIAAREKTAEVLKKEVDKLSRKLSIMDSLTGSSLLWSKKLYDLSEAMIEGVWLSSLYLNTEMPEHGSVVSAVPQPAAKKVATAGAAVQQQPAIREIMVLEGSAISFTPGEETAIVGKFIKSLKDHNGFFSCFDDIKLSSIKGRKLGDIDVMDFVIICYFKQGRSYFEKLAAGDL